MRREGKGQTYMNISCRQRQRNPTITPKDPKRQTPNGNFLVKEETRSHPQYLLLCLHRNSTITRFRERTSIGRDIFV